MKKLRSITENIHTSLYSARNCENESKAVERHVAADCSTGDYDNSMSSAQQNIHSALRHISVQGNNTTNNARCTQARKATQARTAWMDNIKTWTGLSVEESIRMTEDRDK